jgi:eukaryotic-like serine/threonine-protein kinase
LTAGGGTSERDKINALERAARIGTRAGEYEITGVLGRGGMGTVYSGVHPVIGTKVAIKVLDPRITDPSVVVRFIREAQVVNRIRHPNIIEIFAFGESPDLGHYFVMPLLEGDTLAARVEKRGPLPPADALRVLDQVAEALDAAHDAGVYHRDLKPENVMLADDGRGHEIAKVLDFGLAKLSDATSVAVTSEKFSMGTPLYMSPEQWAAVASVDHRTDIYALGVMLHFMLTGRHPFEGNSPVALMKLHTSEPPVPPSAHGAPLAFDPVLAHALAKDRDERHQRASQLAADFAAAVAGQPVDPPRAAGKQRGADAMASTEHASAVTGGARRPGRALVLGAAVVVAAAVAGGLYLARRGEEPAERREPAAGSPPPRAETIATPASPTADAAPPAAAASPGRPTRDRRRPDARRPRRPKVDSTWGKTDDPF